MGCCESLLKEDKPHEEKRHSYADNHPHPAFHTHCQPAAFFAGGYYTYPGIPASQHVFYPGYPPLPHPSQLGGSATAQPLSTMSQYPDGKSSHSVSALTVPATLYFPPHLGPYYPPPGYPGAAPPPYYSALPKPMMQSECVSTTPELVPKKSIEITVIKSVDSEPLVAVKSEELQKQEKFLNTTAESDGVIVEDINPASNPNEQTTPDNLKAEYNEVSEELLSPMPPETPSPNPDLKETQPEESQIHQDTSQAVATDAKQPAESRRQTMEGKSVRVSAPTGTNANNDSAIGLATSLVGAKVWEYTSKPDAAVTKLDKYYSVVETNFYPGAEDPEIDIDKLNEFLERDDSYGFVSRIKPLSERYPDTTESVTPNSPHNTAAGPSKQPSGANQKRKQSGKASRKSLPHEQTTSAIYAGARPSSRSEATRPPSKMTPIEITDKSDSAIPNIQSFSLWEDCNSVQTKSSVKTQRLPVRAQSSASFTGGLNIKTSGGGAASRKGMDNPSDSSPGGTTADMMINVTVAPPKHQLKSNLVKKYDITVDANGRVLINQSDFRPQRSEPMHVHKKQSQLIDRKAEKMKKSLSHDVLTRPTNE